MTNIHKSSQALPIETEINKPAVIKQISLQDEASILISQAIDKNTPVEALEKLLAMRRELKAEKAIVEFVQAMSDFQRDCPTIEKKVKGYNYKYADLTAIVEQIKALLATNGFSYTFDTDEAENKVIVYCKVKHIAGHMEVSKATITKETATKMNASQQSGAAMTYGKRYALVNAFGILTGDEDTDAATPQKPVEQPAPTNTHIGYNNVSQALTRHSGAVVQENLGIKNGAAKGIMNNAHSACLSCHAPGGHLHATSCEVYNK